MKKKMNQKKKDKKMWKTEWIVTEECWELSRKAKRDSSGTGRGAMGIGKEGEIRNVSQARKSRPA